MKKAAAAGAAAAATYPTVTVSDWSEFRDLADSDRFRSWGFRGQGDANWPLESSLTRHLKYSRVHRDAWLGQEERIIRIFRRKAHLFLEHVPDDGDVFQWLALMQHHGAPTRLLDVTWSPYVALFFAIERGSANAAVWAFNAAGITQPAHHDLKSGERIDMSGVGPWVPGSFERDFVGATHAFASVGEPRVMNQRLIAQSGTFLIPSVLDQPVEAILGNYKKGDQLITKIVIDAAKMRDDAMYALYNMNLTNATLFPGLDGLARSMAYELEFHWAFNPRTMEPYPGYRDPSKLGFWGPRRGPAR